MMSSYISGIISIHIRDGFGQAARQIIDVYIKSNSGPRIDLCGTPHDIIWLPERTPLT